MNYLYLTADKIGIPTGGGAVTFHESEAFKELIEANVDKCLIADANLFTGGDGEEPWKWDDAVFHWLQSLPSEYKFDLTHIYSGTFSKTVKELQRRGGKVSYTVAAHDRDISKYEHEQVHGIGFNYPHLVQEDLWQRYIEGIRLADVVICPSKHSERVVRNLGPSFFQKRIEVIPHGCTIPDAPIAPLPSRFAVGYLGAIGPDKGLPYLLEAWGKLNYARSDAQLVIGGRESGSPYMGMLILKFGCQNVEVVGKGWIDDIADFYNQISLYIQPSATEGFGLEVLEAMAHGRRVLCSDHAGACVNSPKSR